VCVCAVQLNSLLSSALYDSPGRMFSGAHGTAYKMGPISCLGAVQSTISHALASKETFISVLYSSQLVTALSYRVLSCMAAVCVPLFPQRTV